MALLGAGCGYGFAAGSGRLPPGAYQVFVRPLANNTADAEVGALVAGALRQELARRDHLGGEGADARIEGEVVTSTFTASSLSSATWEQTLNVRARLMVAGKAVSEQSVERKEQYLGAIDPLESEGRRRLALRRLAAAIARDLVERFQVF